MKKNNTIKEKRIMLEVLEVLMDKLNDERRYTSQEYQKVGVEQKKDDKGELMFDEDGNPLMRNIYDYVDIKPEDMSESALIKIDCIDKLEAVLEKLV